MTEALKTTDPEWMLDEDEEETNDIMSTFIVDNDQKAEWRLQKIREADASAKKFLDFYEQQILQIKQRRDSYIQRMQLYLRRYLIRQREQGLTKSTKTTDKYELPSGVLTLKRGGWDYNRNEPELVDWLRRAGMDSYIKETVKYSPMWGELKKLTKTDDSGNIVLAETGEVIEGVKAVMAPDTFKIE